MPTHNTLQKPLPLRSATSASTSKSSSASAFAGSHGTGNTLFRPSRPVPASTLASSSSTSAVDALVSTSKSLRVLFKGSFEASGTASTRSRQTSANGAVGKGKGTPPNPTLEQPLSGGAEDGTRKRKASLVRRLSTSISTGNTARLSKKTPTVGPASPANGEPPHGRQVDLPSSTLGSNDDAGRFTAPILRDGTLSSPALHLSSDALSTLDPPEVVPSSLSVEALVSPSRSRASTADTIRGAPPPQQQPTPTSTVKRPGVPLQSPIHLDEPSTPARVRHPTAPVSPTTTRKAVLSSTDTLALPTPTPARNHQRAYSSPVQPARQALRHAASFVLKQMARYLPKEVRALPEMGWEECEERLRVLRRAEKTWGAMVGPGGGEGKEQRLFSDALSDGVVLCYLLNRLFSASLRPPLAPSLRPDPSAATRNVRHFLSALGSLGFALEHQFTPADMTASPPSVPGLLRVANTINMLAKMEFDPVAGSSSMKKPPSSGSSSPASSRPGSPGSRPGSPNKVVFVLPETKRKHRSQPVPARRAEIGLPHQQQQQQPQQPRFIPPYQPLRRVTPPSPLRAESGSSRRRVERSASPTVNRLGQGGHSHFSASGPLTPPIEDPVPIEDYLQATPRPSPLAVHARPRTPSLVDEPPEAKSRKSIDSSLSFSSADSARTVLELSGGPQPLISVGSCSSESSHGHGSPAPAATNAGAVLKDVSGFGHGRPTAFTHSNASMPTLPSILRTPSAGSRPTSPIGIRNANVRRVSPSVISRPSSVLRRAGSAADSTLGSSIAPSPRRQLQRRGTSVDLAGTGMSIETLVAEAMAAEIALPSSTTPSKSMVASGSEEAKLGDLPIVEDRPRPLRRNSSASGKSYVVSRSRSLKRSQSPAVPDSSQLEESAVDSAPCTPSSSAFRSTSPPLADHQYRRPEFSTRPTPVAHDAYAKPSASRSAQFAIGVKGEDDEHERRRRHSAFASRPSFSQIRSDGVLDQGRGWGDGRALSQDSSSASLAKDGSGHRELLTVREDGKPTVIYSLGNCIGKGQFGTVYRALQLATGEMVAIKRIRLEGLGDDDVAQLMKEVELVKRLSHPSIVKYQGMMRDDDTLNIVLEYVENGSLGSTLKSFGKFNERLVASYVSKILEGLEYLHSQKVVHCDLKAANILTTKIGNVKLSDFGVSLNLVAVEQKKENDVAGTPNWMAPEVIELKGASPASDIWSLGCVIIELMTGRPPFADCGHSMAVMFRIVEGGPPPIPEGASDELKAFLSQCFEKDPLMRPSAEVLSGHVWLESALAEARDRKLYRQESIPFLSRKSGEFDLRKEAGRSMPISPGYYSTAPGEIDTSDQLNVPTGIDIPGRQQVSPSLPSQVLSLPSSMSAAFPMAADDIVPRAHAFVKSTFSKPVLCRVCHLHVTKSAVLCEGCTLICHRKCVPDAPQLCDINAQMMLAAQRTSQSQQQQYSSASAFPFPSTSAVDDPLLSPVGPSSHVLSTSPSMFNLPDRIIQNLKRARSPAPSMRRDSESRESGASGIKRFVFPSSRPSEDRERPSSRQERPLSRHSNCATRPQSRQSRLSRIGRAGISFASSGGGGGRSSSAVDAECGMPEQDTTTDDVEDDANARFPTGMSPTVESHLLPPPAPGAFFDSPVSSPSAFQSSFAGGGGLTRFSTRSASGGDARSIGHKRKESKDCVIC